MPTRLRSFIHIPGAFMGWFPARKVRNRSTRPERAARKSTSRVGSFESLEAREVFSVTFHGGALLPHVEAQGVYLGSDWASNSTLNSQASALDQYVNYLVKSPYMDTLANAGYNVGEGSATAGKELTLTLNKTTGITDSQIQADLESAISSSQLAAPDANRLYVVYVEPGVKISQGTATSVNSFLGYHGAFAGRTASGQAIDIHYAVMAYPGSPNPTFGSQGFASAFDQLTDVSSHEIAESVTDPNVNYKALGWYDDALNGEIGDLTNARTTLNGYVVQEVVNKSDQPMAIVAGTTGGTTTLAAPQNVTVTALSSTSAQLTWSAVSGASGYRILQISGTTKTVIGTLASTVTSANVTGLTAGSTDSFEVEAYNSTTTADSATVTVTLPGTQSLAAPQNVKITALSTTSAQITWSAVSGASGYRIVQVNGTTKTTIGTLGATATSANITGLAAGSTDSFLVEAYTSTTTADSAVVTVTLPASATKLTAPQLTGYTTSSTTAHLSWNAVTGATGYRLYMWNGYTAVLLGTFNSSTTSVNVTNLAPGGLSQFLVEAYNSTSVADSSWLSLTMPVF
jgi:hypothetical protein